MLGFPLVRLPCLPTKHHTGTARYKVLEYLWLQNLLPIHSSQQRSSYK